MAQQGQEEKNNVECNNSMLKDENKGWNITLFEDQSKISNYLCKHCNFVCDDAVELGCDHNDELIFTYCDNCLSQLIENNNYKCILDDEHWAIKYPVRCIRRAISNATVMCPYDCKWKGKLADLQNVDHLMKCNGIKLETINTQHDQIQNQAQIITEQNTEIMQLKSEMFKLKRQITETPIDISRIKTETKLNPDAPSFAPYIFMPSFAPQKAVTVQERRAIQTQNGRETHRATGNQRGGHGSGQHVAVTVGGYSNRELEYRTYNMKWQQMYNETYSNHVKNEELKQKKKHQNNSKTDMLTTVAMDANEHGNDSIAVYDPIASVDVQSIASTKNAEELDSSCSDVDIIDEYSDCSDAMIIFVQFQQFNILPFHVKSNDTILSVKEKIDHKTGIPVSKQKLVFAARHLRDDYTLIDYDIQTESTLHLHEISKHKPTKKQEIIEIEEIIKKTQEYINGNSNVNSNGVSRFPIPSHKTTDSIPVIPVITPGNSYAISTKLLAHNQAPTHVIINDPIKIFVKPSTCKNFTIVVKPNDLVESLRSKIQNRNGFAPAEQMLLFKSCLLKDGQTLRSYNISQSSTVHLIINRYNKREKRRNRWRKRQRGKVRRRARWKDRESFNGSLASSYTKNGYRTYNSYTQIHSNSNKKIEVLCNINTKISKQKQKNKNKNKNKIKYKNVTNHTVSATNGNNINTRHDQYGTLFMDKSMQINEFECVERLKIILNVYHKWIIQNMVCVGLEKKHKKNKKKTTDIYDIIENEFGDGYNMQKFLNDYRYCVDQNRKAFKIEETERKDKLLYNCDIETCFITQRLNRNKSFMTTHNNKRKEMFFVANIKSNECVKSIIIQQILDTLHFWVYHTLKWDISQYLNYEIENENNDEKDIADFEVLCVDTTIKTLGAIINEKINSSQRYRIKSERYDSHNNKFMTRAVDESYVNIDNKNEEKKKMTLYQSKTDENKQSHLSQKHENEKKNDLKININIINNNSNKLWMDDLFEIMSRYRLNDDLIQQFATYVRDEEYESESIYIDVKNNNNKQSNLLQKFTQNNYNNENKNILQKVLKIFLFETDRDRNVYGEGYCYFYWDYYKNNENEWNQLYKISTGQSSVEGNQGYKLKDWFIPNKYLNFKEELLAYFSFDQYQDTLETAREKRQNWIADASAPKLECVYPIWKKLYAISAGDLIKTEHLMAVILHCNYSHQSFVFCSTYQRHNIYETDASLKKRHSQFHFWAKYLRECVKCFGTWMHHSTINVLYHGVSCGMIFNSTGIRLHRPISTTRDFIIAWSVFGQSHLNLVLHIENDHNSAVYFDCNFWSSYTSEDEKLLLSGRHAVLFSNIHNIGQQIHFKPLMKSITICAQMFRGCALPRVKPLSCDCQVLSELIKCEMNERYLDEPYIAHVPQYISFLFHQFIKQKHEIEINWRYVNVDCIRHSKTMKYDYYGYQMFKSIFLSNQTFQFSMLVKLCKNLKILTLYKRGSRNKGFKSSIKLDENFTNEILKCIDATNKISYSIFHKFEIVKPINSITQFITQNVLIFVNKGWKLKEAKYVNPRSKITSEALVIQKM